MQGNETRFLRHVYVVALAVPVALFLLWLTPEAKGGTAGELLVTYEPEASEQDVDEAVEESEARVEEELSAPDAQLLSFPEAQDETTEAAREREHKEAKGILERDPDVKYVDYNYVRLPAFAPNDPLFNEEEQWNLFKIGAPEAWQTVLGRGAKVAVVDTGITADHPDLRGKIAAQIDVVTNDRRAEDDSLGHGTHVAGTVAAATDNGEGVAAVCPSCKLLVAKSGDQGVFFDSDVVQGIYWRVDNGAKVINLSLGSDGNSRILEHAADYAWQHGVLVVAAAGNENTDEPVYPAAYDDVISVAATDEDDKKARFSNYGKVDVAAPGVNILSTFPGHGYAAKKGTSMASPHVAASAGLLAAQGRTAPEIRRRIERTALDLGAAGKDKYFGWGRIDAERAVLER